MTEIDRVHFELSPVSDTSRGARRCGRCLQPPLSARSYDNMGKELLIFSNQFFDFLPYVLISIPAILLRIVAASIGTTIAIFIPVAIALSVTGYVSYFYAIKYDIQVRQDVFLPDIIDQVKK